jgi:hypothetical protein
MASLCWCLMCRRIIAIWVILPPVVDTINRNWLCR